MLDVRPHAEDAMPGPADHAEDVADVLAATTEWPVDAVAAGVTDGAATIATRGPVDRPFPLASVTKPLAAVGVLLATQYGDLHLDEPAGPAGSTVRHLLAHASGLPMTEDGRSVEVETRRVYSNVGFDVLGDLVADRVGTTFGDHLRDELFTPVGMTTSHLDGSPAHAASSTVEDLLAFARELLAPSLLDGGLVDQLATVQFADLDGVVPGYGRQVPCPWGLGVEIRGNKSPHWTGPGQPAHVFGHFGQSGTFLWIDRHLGAATAVLTDRDFGDWAVQAWTPFNQQLAAAMGGG